MAVELTGLVPSLKRTVNPPGQDLYPNESSSGWVGRLADAFWDARINGFFKNYTLIEDARIAPISGTDELARDLQQVIVTYAAYRAARATLLNLKTQQKSKAGEVEVDTRRNGPLLMALLQDLSRELERLRITLQAKAFPEARFLNMVVLRDEHLLQREEFWA